MILVVMLCIVLIYGSIYTVYQFLNQANYVRRTELAPQAQQASQILPQVDYTDEARIEALAEELEKLEFYLLVTHDTGETIYLNSSGLSRSDYKELHTYSMRDGLVHTYILGGMTVMTYVPENSGIEVYAFNENNVSLDGPWKRLILSIIYVVISILIFVFVLSVVSSYFMSRLSKRVMEPLQLLNAATDRIREENFSEDIQYQGDFEFEEVCNSFNSMQHQVAKARKKQEEYEKARTDMVAGISHDLRTPLTAIQGTLKGLLDGVARTPEMQKKFTETAFRRSVEMSQLLDQLFYFSKIETGNMPVHLQRINWSEYMKEYMEKRKTLDTANVRYYFHETGENIESEIDPREMERILDNLVENSKKYARCEELTISFTLSRKDDRVHLWVSDNGRGVPEEKLGHIFEKFYRADESRNETEGNGLGLHIVKYLTEAMNGKVTAENNEGLEIRFDFPYAEEGEKNG